MIDRNGCVVCKGSVSKRNSTAGGPCRTKHGSTQLTRVNKSVVAHCWQVGDVPRDDTQSLHVKLCLCCNHMIDMMLPWTFPLNVMSQHERKNPICHLRSCLSHEQLEQEFCCCRRCICIWLKLGSNPSPDECCTSLVGNIYKDMPTASIILGQRLHNRCCARTVHLQGHISTAL